MAHVYHFYMDDSGTRHPDHHLILDNAKPDWFGLGGILVRKDHEEQCRRLRDEFCAKWSIESPLHSEEIRHRTKNFRWLAEDLARRQQFLTALQAMLLEMPVIGVSCVIDRPGYHRHFHEKYGKQKWSLCRTAFAISVERAGKFARERGGRLSVFVEKSDWKTDERLKSYFTELKRTGSPFDPKTSSKYDPMDQTVLAETLYDFKIKGKMSPMMQIADLYLYPMCQGGYNPGYYPYMMLKQAERLIDCHVEDVTTLGIKYYCFGDIRPKD